MKIVVLCEGKTEAALKRALSEWIQEHRPATRVGIVIKQCKGKLVGNKFRRQVELNCADADVLGVIGLTDVYGAFESATQAKASLKQTVAGCANAEKFRPHVAQFELEAWLMPFWNEIAERLGVRAKRPPGQPEEIDDQKPPSKHLKELFRRARREYDKVRHAAKWLNAKNLDTAGRSCPELRAFLDSILELAGAEPLP